ncbi:hypothetical protein J8F10_31180 [Gemmata sp. G18]|uniref:Uncharacterized protein n=1 Tax=Gemmata palustris TaxID=2822762 RepID=A0ABS5C164_9BACT|nr:hypothetical protein [Gemmata palustris]MBP3959732.1 hypothetical protein [Gemmata palustris]
MAVSVAALVVVASAVVVFRVALAVAVVSRVASAVVVSRAASAAVVFRVASVVVVSRVASAAVVFRAASVAVVFRAASVVAASVVVVSRVASVVAALAAVALAVAVSRVASVVAALAVVAVRDSGSVEKRRTNPYCLLRFVLDYLRRPGLFRGGFLLRAMSVHFPRLLLLDRKAPVVRCVSRRNHFKKPLRFPPIFHCSIFARTESEGIPEHSRKSVGSAHLVPKVGARVK